MRGAEAVLSRKSFISLPVLYKDRIKKSYRIPQLDVVLRRSRTKREARLLHAAKLAGVGCPTVLMVSDVGLLLSIIKGRKYKRLDRKKAFSAGMTLATLHRNGIIHGDFTPANLLFSGKKIFVIDFGLGFFSNDTEDKAVDVLTMLKSLDKKAHPAFLRGYKKYAGFESVIGRVEQIKSRARYA